MATITIAADDETLVRDCYACLAAIGARNNRPALPPFTLGGNSAPTPLEAVLVTELAHARLARHLNHQTEHDQVNVGVRLLFHGADTLGDVSPAKWAEFDRRTQALHRLYDSVYRWIEEMERTCRRTFELEYMQVFEMYDGVRIAIAIEEFAAYNRRKRLGRSG